MRSDEEEMHEIDEVANEDVESGMQAKAVDCLDFF